MYPIWHKCEQAINFLCWHFKLTPSGVAGVLAHIALFFSSTLGFFVILSITLSSNLFAIFIPIVTMFTVSFIAGLIEDEIPISVSTPFIIAACLILVQSTDVFSGWGLEACMLWSSINLPITEISTSLWQRRKSDWLVYSGESLPEPRRFKECIISAIWSIFCCIDFVLWIPHLPIDLKSSPQICMKFGLYFLIPVFALMLVVYIFAAVVPRPPQRRKSKIWRVSQNTQIT